MQIKICGLTDPEEAGYAASLGANYIGILFSSYSKRCVPLNRAKEIAQAAHLNGALAVGVFVDETADQIRSLCEQAEIQVIQLHGKRSQQDAVGLYRDYPLIFYAVPVGFDGHLDQPHDLPACAYPLYDHLSGGTGQTFEWKAFTPPKNKPWMLAGGLNPHNVGSAIRLLQPSGVDVASGVEYPQSVRKNPLLVKAFIEAVKEAKEKK
ncbi:phosphoribosylanthranilate isomerase [Candidatus Protochlamydia phocaeensis]|uniref:phosphoribosylanthranilate isomerase n=1 Tax=Candidatus Protochlamydia phocaeensis TaxID=1414722 RepID=UPI00083894DC|nr:phosphoribosylanthranilate isomerase [Candidatus Protochlamydia phocaeensis]